MNNETDINSNERYYNLDLLKSLSIICMILCHAVIQLGLHRTGYSQKIPYLVGDYIFGCYIGVAHAF
ncbi:MAG: hypothetical protein K6B68_11170, partial [Eubacterium sp.]|nr:hypothetical protein [Eubacterium sp.]